MRFRQALPALVAASLLLPGAAFAGAPNYDCTLQGGARLAIDQWRPKVVALGVGSHATVGGAVQDIAQDGPTLSFTTTLSGTRWSVAIRAYGASMTMTSPGSTLTGRCQFVPGNYILRASDRGGHMLRAAPVATAAARLSVRVGAPVWESPNASPKGTWLPVLVVWPHGGVLSSAHGWIRQLGPYQARANS
jgi:hypothetical protein